VPIAWLAATRRWRAAAAACAAAGLAVALGAAVYGAGSYAEWASGLGRIGWWWLPMNASLRGLVSRLFDAGAAMDPVVRAPWLVQPVWVLLAGVVVVATVWRTWRPGERISRPAAADATLLVLVLAALLVSPLGWVYYLPLVTGPALALASGEFMRGMRGWRRGLLLGSVALFYVPFEVAEAGQPSAFATLALASVYGWGLLGWWTALVVRPLEPAPPRSA
jgi:alpha-1,2-mannosyltransferase